MRAGCDLVHVARFAAAIERRPQLRERVFTPRELADAGRGDLEPDEELVMERLAARWAAKEATRKALNDLRIPFHDVEVRTGDGGEPLLWLRGAPAGMACSLSHDGGLAMAFVIAP